MKPLIAALVIFVVALTPRLHMLDAYVTIDESRWIQRTGDFYALVLQQDPEDTFIIGHPGVTTMWTALVGMGPETALSFSFLEGKTDATRRDGYFDALIAARRPFALIAAAGVAVVTLLGWRLFGAGPALLGGALLALEPFLVAHARVVHLDSALTTYTAICLLSAMIWAQAGGGFGYLALSGLAGGLAFLTKAPSVFVLGFVPLMATSNLLAQARIFSRSHLLKGNGRVLHLVVWALIIAAVCLLLWPAMRANPGGTLQKMAQFTERVGGGEHDNFFLGQPLEDPGPFFYPLSLLFRLSPITLLGFIFALGGWRLLSPSHRQAVLTLGAYCVGFLLMMSVAPKKFDRYLLPLYPAIGLLAGLGLWMVTCWVLGRLRAIAPVGRSRQRKGLLRVSGFTAATAAFVISFVGLHAAPLLAIHPYELAYYNPILGGGAVAQRAILVGWGEGLDQVARYVSAQPRSLGEPTVATSYHRVLQAQIDGSALPLERVRMADYVVPYVNTLQRGAEREVLAPFLDSGPPELTVRINGIEYARVYRGPHYPRGEAVGARFGDSLTLVEYLAAPGNGPVRSGEEIHTMLRWDRAASADERASLMLVGPDGRPVAQDERPVGADGPDESGRPGEIHRLAIPARLAPGQYALAVRVTGPRSRSSLPVAASPGGEMVTLRTVVVERAE